MELQKKFLTETNPVTNVEGNEPPDSPEVNSIPDFAEPESADMRKRKSLNEGPSKVHTRACRTCEYCKQEDCRDSENCFDKRKYGGPNIKRQRCINKERCINVPSGTGGKKTDKPANVEIGKISKPGGETEYFKVVSHYRGNEYILESKGGEWSKVNLNKATRTS